MFICAHLYIFIISYFIILFSFLLLISSSCVWDNFRWLLFFFFSGNVFNFLFLCCLVVKTCLTLCDPWTIACKAPLSMRFPRQNIWQAVISFSKEVSWPRDQTHVFYIQSVVGRFFMVSHQGSLIIINVLKDQISSNSCCFNLLAFSSSYGF